ncbi:hypothetical protein [Azohydromonas australica]|uniref:hypothetical protein n=1 Tax=Azohydromonas australica TaxID=364039 RepID=UPI001B7FE1A4|nr:hypothetical protein [Azohydromonas australica]
MRFGIERFAQSLIDDHAGSARQLWLVCVTGQMPMPLPVAIAGAAFLAQGQ